MGGVYGKEEGGWREGGEVKDCLLCDLCDLSERMKKILIFHIVRAKKRHVIYL